MAQKVLLVEDDDSLREIYGERLKAEGFEILSARDGEEALAIAVQERPDITVCDIMMPKISGFDVLDILHSNPDTKDLKVIVMSALSQEEDKSRAKRLGADRYLVKSEVTLEDLVKTTKEVVSGLKSSEPVENQPAPAQESPTTAEMVTPTPGQENPQPDNPTTATPTIPKQPTDEHQQTSNKRPTNDDGKTANDKPESDDDSIYEGISNPNMTI